MTVLLLFVVVAVGFGCVRLCVPSAAFILVHNTSEWFRRTSYFVSGCLVDTMAKFAKSQQRFERLPPPSFSPPLSPSYIRRPPLLSLLSLQMTKEGRNFLSLCWIIQGIFFRAKGAAATAYSSSTFLSNIVLWGLSQTELRDRQQLAKRNTIQLSTFIFTQIPSPPWLFLYRR